MKQLRLLITIGFLLFISNSLDSQNPYKSLGKDTEVLTLSNGKYNEFISNDTIVPIGSVLLNTVTGEVIGFIEKDTLHSEYSLKPEVVSRWLAPDPLAHQFSEWSPYNFVYDNPIIYVDPDGRAPDTTRLYSLSGTLLETIDDSHSNEEHFISQEKYDELNTPPDDACSVSCSVDDRGTLFRENSSFFIGANSRTALKSTIGDGKDGNERMFLFFMTNENKELQVFDITNEHVQDTDRDPNGVKITPSKAEYILRNASSTTGVEGSIIMGGGHTHTLKGLQILSARLNLSINN